MKPGPKTGLVTHKGCLDGTGSALMFVWAGGDPKNVLFKAPSTCNLTPEEAAPFDEIIFADLCPSGPLTDDVAGGKPFHVYDHHVSNQRLYGEDPNCTFSMKHSGTSLMACEFLPLVMPDENYRLIQALEAYDLGRFDERDGVFLADLAVTFKQEDMLWMLTRYGADLFNDEVMRGRAEAMAAVRNLYSEQAAKYARVIDFEGIDAAVASSPVYWKNEVATRILTTHDLAIVIDPMGQMVSLRSKEGGPDCSMIASRYGGGGHKKAAGFKANGQEILNAMLEAVIG